MGIRVSKTSALVAAVIAGAFLSFGCNCRPYITDERLNKGLVVILPGIEGPSPLNMSIRKGLYDGGVPYAISIYNWPSGIPGFAYAFSENQCEKRADELAWTIRRYRAEHSGCPVFVVGHSAGAGIAVLTAEHMQASEPLTGVVALAPPLSPEYDVTRALAGSGNRLCCCSDAHDVFLKGLIAFGRNVDGTKGATAGQDGFALPASASAGRREAFSHLRQIRWDSSMSQYGNHGGHFGWTSPPWVAATIAPILSNWAAGAEYPPVRASGKTSKAGSIVIATGKTNG
jgi:hypothetical protein